MNDCLFDEMCQKLIEYADNVSSNVIEEEVKQIVIDDMMNLHNITVTIESLNKFMELAKKEAKSIKDRDNKKMKRMAIVQRSISGARTRKQSMAAAEQLRKLQKQQEKRPKATKFNQLTEGMIDVHYAFKRLKERNKQSKKDVERDIADHNGDVADSVGVHDVGTNISIIAPSLSIDSDICEVSSSRASQSSPSPRSQSSTSSSGSSPMDTLSPANQIHVIKARNKEIKRQLAAEVSKRAKLRESRENLFFEYMQKKLEQVDERGELIKRLGVATDLLIEVLRKQVERDATRGESHINE
jgi:hypothetical protein